MEEQKLIELLIRHNIVADRDDILFRQLFGAVERIYKKEFRVLNFYNLEAFLNTEIISKYPADKKLLQLRNAVFTIERINNKINILLSLFKIGRHEAERYAGSIGEVQLPHIENEIDKIYEFKKGDELVYSSASTKRLN